MRKSPKNMINRGARKIETALSTGGTAMNNLSELTERAEKLAQQIGLIQIEFRTGDVNTKIDDIGNVLKKLRHDNDRLARENEELKGSLKSLISSVENSRLSELPDSFQGVGRKLDAILETGRASDVPAEARTTARFGVVADIVQMPKEGRAEASAAKEPDKPEIPSGLRRGPG